jgi:hypothetical protein
MKNMEQKAIGLLKFLPWRIQSFIGLRPNGYLTFENIKNMKSFKILYGEKSLDIEGLVMPFHVEPELHANFKMANFDNYKKYCVSFYCLETRNAMVLDVHNVVTLLSKNKIILPLSTDPLKRKHHPARNIKYYPEKKILKGKTLLLSTTGAQGNYFHWSIDLLQKVGFANACGYAIKEFDFILVNKISQKFQTELLNIFGVPMEKIIETMPGCFYQCEQVVAPSYTPHSYFGFSFLRKHLLEVVYHQVF